MFFFTIKYGGFPVNVPGNQSNDIILFYTIFSGWCFQPFWKIWVNGKNYPIYHGKKNGWNHQPVLYQYLKHLNMWADRSTHTHIFQWSLVSVKMTILQSNIKRTFSNCTQLEILWTNYSREYNFKYNLFPKHVESGCACFTVRGHHPGWTTGNMRRAYCRSSESMQLVAN